MTKRKSLAEGVDEMRHVRARNLETLLKPLTDDVNNVTCEKHDFKRRSLLSLPDVQPNVIRAEFHLEIVPCTICKRQSERRQQIFCAYFIPRPHGYAMIPLNFNSAYCFNYIKPSDGKECFCLREICYGCASDIQAFLDDKSSRRVELEVLSRHFVPELVLMIVEYYFEDRRRNCTECTSL